MGKVTPKFQLQESLGEKVEIGRPVSQFELIKLIGRGGQTQLLTPALAQAKTGRSFAHIYVQGNPEVFSSGKVLEQKLRSAARSHSLN
jgi:hypothetical protein